MRNTKLKNEMIIEAIGQQLIDDLNRLVELRPWIELEARKYHENCINEREICHVDPHDQRLSGSEKFTFDMLFELIINAELEDIYESLADSSQKAVRNYVKDIYPDWRETMDYARETMDYA